MATVSFLQKMYMRPKNVRRRTQRRPVTEKLLLEMKSLCDAQRTHFIVAMLQSEHYIEFCREIEIDFVDCAFPLTSEMKVRGVGHPNGKMHTLWADCIAKKIDGYLKVDASQK